MTKIDKTKTTDTGKTQVFACLDTSPCIQEVMQKNTDAFESRLDAQEDSCKESTNTAQLDGLVLFSGGLDSVLAARVLMDQGLRIRCLHFVSPFFGNAHAVPRWQRLYGLDIEAIDIGQEMVELISAWPEHGFGKVMNPCVDCKILMLKHARAYQARVGGKFIATGEVMGQRPMSQRRDTLNIIRREADVQDFLLRPLSALHLDPTPVEESGLVDRSKLLRIHGRGRHEQLALAEHYGFTEIPSPGGGCLLTERENARQYWPLRSRPKPDVRDFLLASCGRQTWFFDEHKKGHWLITGRNARDNTGIKEHWRGQDLLVGLCDFSGPLALLKEGKDWDDAIKRLALASVASYSPKAVAAGGEVRMWVKEVSGKQVVISVEPDPSRSSFKAYAWESVRDEKHALTCAFEATRKKRQRPFKRKERSEQVQEAETTTINVEAQAEGHEETPTSTVAIADTK